MPGLDLGVFTEGVLEQDLQGLITLRIQNEDGSSHIVDVAGALKKYLGKEVRLIVTPVESILLLENQLGSK